ncbi:hypothetical protein ANN_00634 [Periplaneta americana]|uniref:TMEM205-like domain-containing protein n=1 Tax=Periplaneta americana TaxID=6978 RepID=A0ABQ8TU65_PERAM|nr:hypothetical protein ANN_00634 [Periplaneta americana]
MCARSKIGEDSPIVGATNQESKKQTQRLRRLKRKAMQEHAAAEAESHVAEVQETCPLPAKTEAGSTFYKDILYVVTDKQRQIVWAVYDLLGKWQQTKSYKILFETTQPAHILMFFAITVIAMLLNPARCSDDIQTKPTPIISLIYLSSFMMHFGSQMWMTFVSGLSLYFAVPRHTFGEVQQVLFPRYFGLNSVLSLVTLVVFVKLHPTSTWDTYTALQVGSMALSFLVELLIRLYLAPPLLSLIAAKIAMEKAAGVGLEVGRHDPGPLAKCPHYVKIHKAFRKVHMSIAIGNLTSMGCTVLHLMYLANKISVL